MSVIDYLSVVWPFVLAGVSLVVAVVTSAHIVLYKRDVRAAIAWVGLTWFSPLIGALLYALFGVNRLRRRAVKLRRRNGESAGGERAGDEPALEAGLHPDARPNLAALRAMTGGVTDLPLTSGNRVEPLVNGDAAFPQMLRAIDGARSSVALASYIFDNDRAGRRFLEALERAARRGVEVRVLVDGVGARYSRPRITRVLSRHGVRCAEFLSSRLIWRNPYFNLRNHRKILVVDGRVGFTGGMNIREGCLLALDPEHPVQDLHFRIEGPVVQYLTTVFAEDWAFTTGEFLEGDAWFPRIDPVGSVAARGVPDGPDDDFETIRWTLLAALATSQDRVRIVTPYFLPDQPLLTALNVTAMRGVRVDIVLPQENNLRFVQWAMHAQLWQVLQRGCRIWLSRPPFDHTKLVLVDHAWAMVGSANWDPRSLRLNFEFNVECYDAALVEALDRLVEQKIGQGRELTSDALNGRPMRIKLRDGVSRLMAPYL